jgi:hypothetical protein
MQAQEGERKLDVRLVATRTSMKDTYRRLSSEGDLDSSDEGSSGSRFAPEKALR